MILVGANIVEPLLPVHHDGVYSDVVAKILNTCVHVSMVRSSAVCIHRVPDVSMKPSWLTYKEIWVRTSSLHSCM